MMIVQVTNNCMSILMGTKGWSRNFEEGGGIFLWTYNKANLVKPY